MATHSSILAWRIPRTEEPGGLQSTGSQSQTRLKLLGTHVPILRVISETLATRGLKWSFDVLFAFC